MSIGRLENEADLARFVQGELGKPSALTARLAEVEAHGGGAHASTHASGGSDPLAVASLDPTVLNAESPYTQIQTGTSGTVYVTSSTAVWLTGCEVTVQAGQRAFLVCRFDVNIEEGCIFALFIADNPSKTNISQEAYVETSATGWNRLSPVLFGFVAPASDTKYVVGGRRISGGKTAEINPQTTLAKIVLGGKP